MRRWMVLGSMLGLWAVSVVQGLHAEEESITLAVCAPFTGDCADYGKMIQRGVNLKLKEINDKGGIHGRKVRLVFKDDEGRGDAAAIVAHDVASNNSISAVIGHFNSSCSMAAKPIYMKQGLVALTPGSTNVDVCQGSPWFFRNLYRDDFQGECIARFLAECLKVHRVVVIYENDTYGTGLKTFFLKKAQELGLEIVSEYGYNRESKDFSSIISKVKYGNPEVVFVSGLYTEAGLIASMMASKGVKIPLIAGDGVFSPQFIEIAGPAAEGAMITTPYVNDPAAGPLVAPFAEAFMMEFKEEPDFCAALSYDALGTLAKVIEKVGPDRTAIRDELARMTTPETGYIGVTGNTYFDSNGDCSKPLFVSRVRNGKLTYCEMQLPPESPKAAPPVVAIRPAMETVPSQPKPEETPEASKGLGVSVYLAVGVLAAVILMLFRRRRT
ncbi:MAG: ABC transporter substrate-binding protein [Planctomycetota bacterium]